MRRKFNEIDEDSLNFNTECSDDSLNALHTSIYEAVNSEGKSFYPKMIFVLQPFPSSYDTIGTISHKPIA